MYDFLDNTSFLSYDRVALILEKPVPQTRRQAFYPIMKAERLILSFVAILIGLLVAGGAFYIYQMTKALPADETKAITISSPTPTPDSNKLLTISSPRNEEVVNKKTISVAGKTLPEATIIVSSESGDQVVKPTRTGDFSVTQTIGNDSNIIQITAVFPNGEESKVTRVVNFSTEDF
jgi:hypothetical protein